MHRAALIAVPCLSALLMSGCFHYDARATNLSGQDIEVSVHKGKKQVELSTVSLPPGKSISWEGDTNGPVLVRFEAAGETMDVRLPRKRHTDLTAETTSGSLRVTKKVNGVEACCTDADCECAEGEAECATCSQQAAQPAPEGGEQPESVDLVEPEQR